MTGRTKGLNNKHTFKAVALTVTALVMLSCQQEQLEGNRIALYPVIEGRIEGAVFTRATGDPVDKTLYSEYTGDRQILSVNAIAFSPNSNDRASDKDGAGSFIPLQAGGWRTVVTVEQNYRYNLYVYSQAMPAPVAPQFNYNGSSTSLTFNNGLYLLTELDPLVCIAAAGDLRADSETDPATYPALTEGVFNIGNITKVTEGDVEKTTKAFLALDHLYAKATLSFKVDETYNELRDIRIKKVEISTANGTLTGTHTFTFGNNSLNIPTGNGITVGGDAATIRLFSCQPTDVVQPDADKDYFTLPTTATTFGSFCFLPLNPLKTISLTVTYDICDKAGNVTRANQTAVNNSLFSGISNNGGKAERGVNYKINVTVSPTYLYVLSDGDVDTDMELTVE